MPQNIGKEAADAIEEVAKVNIPNQRGEDSLPEPQGSEDLADDKEAADVVLLCIKGQVNDHVVTFLIDSGASECFISTEFVAENELF